MMKPMKSSIFVVRNSECPIGRAVGRTMSFNLFNDGQKMFKIIFAVLGYLTEENAMPIRRSTSAIHEKILESARRLFNNKGFSEVSIDEVMENAGLTRGGFYRHFRDKDELYAEAVRRFLCTDAPKPGNPSRPIRDGAQATSQRGR
jgi:hypothetical protein